MVKADLTRDYYGDLEVAPTADINEIKKQFKKLALQYHPDRNPGRESEVTSAFQKIQSAHEVLTDQQERAKYDANRVRPANRYQTGGNQRGNPWSNVSSQYPTPPKPPTARNRPPPPSAGAQRYKNFETPRQSANQSAQEGPEARRSTYAAWEHMRNAGTKTGPGANTRDPPPVPNRAPQSGRGDGGSSTRPYPKATPGYDEFRQNYSPGASPHRRAQSTSAQNRKGFMPNTPVGDEPAAPRNAYFTERKSAQAPNPPPRNTAPPPPPPTPVVDPLRQFREKANAPYEPRLSTPYATHGGEKLNPFESSNMSRSKSTREPRDRSDQSSQNIPRAGSDSNLNSPNHRPRRNTNSRPNQAYAAPASGSDSSSSDAGPELKTRSYESRPFAKARNYTQSTPQPNTFSTAKQKNSTQTSTNNGEQQTYVPSRSGQPNQQPNGESIFSFKVDENTFQRTKSNGFSSSTENINTKFTPEEWDGKFEAGYFQPEQKAANMSHARTRAQSGSRSRGRSPVKPNPNPNIDPHYAQYPQSEPETHAESPGGTKFSQAEWAGTFKPQTFMPTHPTPSQAGKVPPRSTRKARAPTLKPTMGTAAVIDDSSDSSIEKPLFTGRKSFAATTPTKSTQLPAPSPDAMDVDTPPVFNPATSTQGPPDNLKVNSSPGKRPAAPSGTASPTDQETLKVNFEEMKIQDIISSMNLPKPPAAPQIIQTANDNVRPTEAEYESYLARVAEYMKQWDLFNNRIMLHLVARKNQNDGLGERRWMDDQGMEIYRQGLREDKVVLGHWVGAENGHAEVLKAHAIVRERMKDKTERQPPRKKVS